MGRYNATFTSVWDGGICVNSRCFVNKFGKVMRMGKNDVNSSVEENLEELEEEYVILDKDETNTKHPAKHEMDKESTDSPDTIYY